jgi:hypothetical protein
MVTLPAVICKTVKTTVAEAPLLKPPRLQSAVPAVEQGPIEGMTDVRTPAEGTKAARATLEAAEGPLLVTLAV